MTVIESYLCVFLEGLARPAQTFISLHQSEPSAFVLGTVQLYPYGFCLYLQQPLPNILAYQTNI